MRTPALPSPRPRGIVGLTVAALVASPLAFGLATPASADVSTQITSLPYTQGWPATTITADDDWSTATGLQGYLGQGLTSATGVDAKSVTGDSTVVSPSDTDVIANQGAPATLNSGGVAEFDTLADPSIALQGSGTADAPYVAFHLDLTGESNPTFAFDARDLDASADDAAQQVAVQYRVGAAGPYTNISAGYIADATTANAATQVTPVSVVLPDNVNNQSSVFVRVLTTNAVGNDEWVGIDNVSITTTSTPGALNVINPGPQSGTVGTPITPIVLEASGGTAPYTVTATNLPDGLTFDAATDTISGTPLTAGPKTVEISVTDNASGTDTDSFVWTIAAAAPLRSIAEIQGTDSSTTPLAGQSVKTRGVVTATYPTGGINGFVIQTGGTGGAADATPGASDAIFVWGGNDGFTTYPEVGDSLELTGTAVEGGGPATGLTQIVVDDDSLVVELGTPLPAVTPWASGLPATDAAREAHESELIAPTGPFTISDVYDGSSSATTGFFNFGEIMLASGTTPLVQPTEVEDAQTGDISGVVADNSARRVLLDDGASINFVTSPGFNNQLPWMSKSYAPRVGAAATFVAPVILEFRNGFWKFQPTTRVTDTGTNVVTFENTRPANLLPQDVGGTLKLATFNVLNYFNTTGADWEASGKNCDFFNDRAGTPITNQSCANNGPRGAATDVSFARQQAKIVNAINRLDADVVSLEEIENSIALGEANRDDALSALVDALNTAAGSTRWAFVPSPAAADLPPLAEQDVIRNAFIYDPSTTTLVGASKVLVNDPVFSNAREPLAQAFKAVGAPDAEAFGVVVNHFKSKGAPSGNNACTGLGDNSDPVQGCFNGDRLRQAQSLATFADGFAAERGLKAMFLTGDFNSYTEEDPIQSLEDDGYTSLESDTEGEESYSFNGLSGSLDHVLANDAALAWVKGVDIWEINANESLFYQYSRFNYTASDLFDGSVPFAASDHNPEIVGITPASVVPPAPGAKDTTLTGTATPVVYGKAGSVAVKVAPATATGKVTLSQGSVVIGSTTLSSGAGTIAVPALALPAGSYTLALSYAGDATHKPSTGTVALVVAKATPTVAARVKPRPVKAGKTRAKVVIRVRADGYTPTGKVRVRVAGKVYRARLVDGKAVVKLKKIAKPRRYRAKVRYLGDANTEVARTSVRFRVKRR